MHITIKIRRGGAAKEGKHNGLQGWGSYRFAAIWFYTQQDPIGIAGGLNLYGFAGGDPVNFSDPFGLCPDEAKNGEVCLDFFIKSKRSGLWKGDGRDFDPNAAPEQSRVQVVAGPGGISFEHASESCIRTCVPSTVDATFTPGDNGSFTITVRATNKKRVLGLPNPAINATVTFTPNGSGGYTTSGNRDYMPSLGIYHRKNDMWVQLEARSGVAAVYLLPPMPNDKWGR